MAVAAQQLEPSELVRARRGLVMGHLGSVH